MNFIYVLPRWEVLSQNLGYYEMLLVGNMILRFQYVIHQKLTLSFTFELNFEINDFLIGYYDLVVMT